jgi:membrane protein implicated in regulation of membrane protease activity
MGVKIVSTSMLWATIIGSIIFVANGKLWLQILLFAIAVGVTVHILSYKTKKKG